MKYCEKCGTQMSDDSTFCPTCGQKQTKIEAASSEVAVPKPPKQRSGTRKIAIMVIVIAVVIAGIAWLSYDPTNDIEDAYSQCTTDCSQISDDHTSIWIDSNPDDKYDVYDSGADEDVDAINAYLGLPDSLDKKMGNTCGNDGKQTETYGDIEVTWSYSPSNGFEVLYTLI